MQKAILISILLMTVALPAIAARGRDPLLGIRRVVGWMAAAVLAYVLALIFVYPRV